MTGFPVTHSTPCLKVSAHSDSVFFRSCSPTSIEAPPYASIYIVCVVLSLFHICHPTSYTLFKAALTFLNLPLSSHLETSSRVYWVTLLLIIDYLLQSQTRPIINPFSPMARAFPLALHKTLDNMFLEFYICRWYRTKQRTLVKQTQKAIKLIRIVDISEIARSKSDA